MDVLTTKQCYNEQNICNTSITCQYKQACEVFISSACHVEIHTAKIVKASALHCNTNVVYGVASFAQSPSSQLVYPVGQAEQAPPLL